MLFFFLITFLAINSECAQRNFTDGQIRHEGKHPTSGRSDKNKQKIPIAVTEEAISLEPKDDEPPNMIAPSLVRKWAQEISDKFYETEAKLVRRELLLQNYPDIKFESRNGTAIVQKMSDALVDLLTRRIEAAEEIMKAAEKLAEVATYAPEGYQYDYSVGLDQIKPVPTKDPYTYLPCEILPTCRSLSRVKVHPNRRFGSRVSFERSSVQVAMEVFECVPDVTSHLHWSEGLLSKFRKNYEEDNSMSFQYFCSTKGFLRHYPAAPWEDMFKWKIEDEEIADLYDCRLRPWYVSAQGAPSDVLIMLDASGSLDNSSNLVTAEVFINALLSALTDDDQVNVLRFNSVVNVESPIPCFNDILVPANYINSAAMMRAMQGYKLVNFTNIKEHLTYAVDLLKKQKDAPDRPTACHQAIVLLVDSIEHNYTQTMRELDPEGHIRLFVVWLHDPNGLRDFTEAYAEHLSCSRDGYYAELISHPDVTLQVLKILQVMERPLVAQRTKRLRVFSDVYAHVEDPRRGDYKWHLKENAEQAYRYLELRRNKKGLMDSSRLMKDFMYQESLQTMGHYYEGQDIDYNLQISVSVPVFDSTTLENITITLREEKQRNSTRTYPVNRLLGVAGIDIPVSEIKLLLPYHELGGGGSLFLVDHRGNVVLHDNVKSVFEGDLLRPGYRTVDFFEIEQAAEYHRPRFFPKAWTAFRKALVFEQTKGQQKLNGKQVFMNGTRALLEEREYSWLRILDHYTAVVVLPAYGRRHPSPEANFTRLLAEQAFQTLSRTEFSIHPDWLYCRHVEFRFDTRTAELLHFLRRRRDEDEKQFPMKKMKSKVVPLPLKIVDESYQCNEKLMTHLCLEAIATAPWAHEHEELGPSRGCTSCQFGSVTTFYASESGLTRWQPYHATSAHADPPEGSAWPRGPGEAWYKRAAAAQGSMVVHAPVVTIRKMRESSTKPPALGEEYRWLTAARTLELPGKGVIGVTGFHFHPTHLEDLFKAITDFPVSGCEETKEGCTPQCDGDSWSCLLIDDGGWILAGGKPLMPSPNQELNSQHLATAFPTAMDALLNASVFKLNWIHDYQAVCFEYLEKKKEMKKNSAISLPSLLRSVWRTLNLMLHIAKEIITLVTILGTSCTVRGDTFVEREKRKNRTYLNFEREKYDRLYDEKVLVNRTRFAACDRSRAMYELQRTPQATEALRRPAEPCTWPLVGAMVPRTNLLLLAIYNLCPPVDTRPLPDPLTNEPVLMEEEVVKRPAGPAPAPAKRVKLSEAARLACWRNRQPLPGRAPATECYPHQYKEEEGYRQCGPWLPNPEPDE